MAEASMLRAARVLAVVLAAGNLTAAGYGQDAAPPAMTGKDFAGKRFPQAPVSGPLSFAGRSAYSWQEGSTRRLILEGDVRVRVAQYSFVARRVAVWMEAIPGAGQPQSQQLFLYFENLVDPAEPAASGFSADRLPVRAVVRVEGAIGLSCDAITPREPAPADLPELAAFSREAQAAFVRSLTRLDGSPQPAATLPPLPTVSAAPQNNRDSSGLVPAPARPAPPPGPLETQAVRKLAEAGAVPEAIFARQGIITVGAKDLTVVSGTDENAVIASGGVVVLYQDIKTGRTLQLSAQRAVLFTDPGQLQDMVRFTVEQVRGIFLEGEVTGSDGRFTLRGPRVYYDVRNNHAVMVDAVFWTYDEKRQLPLYVRAKTVRQTAADQYQAEGAQLTNSAFFDPELSIGASTVTVSRRQEPAPVESELDRKSSRPVQSTAFVQAEDVTLRAAGVPVFYWPTFSGDPAQMPVRDLRFENRSGSGGAVKATFDAYSLLGMKKSADRRFDLLTDMYFERGPALGTRLGWNEESSRGSLFAYMVPYDHGTDILKSGARRDHDGDFRGIIVGDNRWRVDDKWSLFAEAAYISDATFIDGFYEEQGETRREFTNRLRADRVEGNSAFSMEAKGSFNDFISNEWLLQSQGYTVSKYPEATYIRQADDLLKESYPGLVSYWSEYRAGAMQLQFDERRANQRGFETDALAQRAFGYNADQSWGDVLRTAGLPQHTVFRADTRQEFSVNANAGPVKITPFVVGRVTAYDNDFDQYSPDEGDNVRLWGSAGVRASTQLQHVYDGADSRIFDIHRLRHIVEPSITAWYAGTNVQGQDLPVFDESVESLADGTIGRAGVKQIFQTQRGGPGRWHSVDLVTLNTDFVFASGDTNQKTPIGRFFDYRPEYANPGNYFVGDIVYRLTDATALTGATVFDLDLGQQAMSNAGLSIQHTPEFSTYADVRYINALDSTYLNMGIQYDLTSKYMVTAGAAYDLNEGGFQTEYVEVRRRFSSMLLGLSVGYNDITGETSFGFVFQPYGATGSGHLASGSAGTASGSSGSGF